MHQSNENEHDRCIIGDVHLSRTAKKISRGAKRLHKGLAKIRTFALVSYCLELFPQQTKNLKREYTSDKQIPASGACFIQLIFIQGLLCIV